MSKGSRALNTLFSERAYIEDIDYGQMASPQGVAAFRDLLRIPNRIREFIASADEAVEFLTALHNSDNESEREMVRGFLSRDGVIKRLAQGGQAQAVWDLVSDMDIVDMASVFSADDAVAALIENLDCRDEIMNFLNDDALTEEELRCILATDRTVGALVDNNLRADEVLSMVLDMELLEDQLTVFSADGAVDKLAMDEGHAEIIMGQLRQMTVHERARVYASDGAVFRLTESEEYLGEIMADLQALPERQQAGILCANNAVDGILNTNPKYAYLLMDIIEDLSEDRQYAVLHSQGTMDALVEAGMLEEVNDLLEDHGELPYQVSDAAEDFTI